MLACRDEAEESQLPAEPTCLSETVPGPASIQKRLPSSREGRFALSDVVIAAAPGQSLDACVKVPLQSSWLKMLPGGGVAPCFGPKSSGARTASAVDLTYVSMPTSPALFTPGLSKP